MIIKHKEQRVGVFIDTQNLYHSAKNLFGHKVNFAKIVEDSLAGRKLIRSIAYVITSEAGDEQGFFEALHKNGIETRTKDLQVFIGGSKKGDWDVGLAVDAITMAPKLDAVILISGDGDFVPLVNYLQTHSGIQVEVASFAQSSSQRLIDASDDFMDLSKSPEKYLIGFRPRKQNRKNKNKQTKQNNVTITKAVPK
ncbi:MAG: NYN domain-containing protein [Candidatus Paceibacterota bacterium]